jgi:hypothetical protein
MQAHVNEDESDDILSSNKKDFVISSSQKQKQKVEKQLFKPLPSPVKSSQSHIKGANLGKSHFFRCATMLQILWLFVFALCFGHFPFLTYIFL